VQAVSDANEKCTMKNANALLIFDFCILNFEF